MNAGNERRASLLYWKVTFNKVWVEIAFSTKDEYILLRHKFIDFMYRTSAHHIYSNLFKCIDIFLFDVMYINFIEEGKWPKWNHDGSFAYGPCAGNGVATLRRIS